MKIGGRARVPEQQAADPAAGPVAGSTAAGGTRLAGSQPTRPSDTSVYAGGRRLGELLVDSGIVAHTAVIEALAANQHDPSKFLGQRLVEAGLVDERTVARVVAWQRSLEVVDLRTVSPEPAATRLLDEQIARRIIAIPLTESGGAVVVAVAFPTDATRLALQQAVGHPIDMKVAAESDIMRAIGNSYRALTGITGQVRVFQAQHASWQESGRAEMVSAGDEDAPVVQVVQMMLIQALRDRASDIHIEPQQDQVRVRYRIDGALHDVLQLPPTMGPAVSSRVKIMAGMNIVERRRPQDGQISMEVEGREVDIRVSTTAVLEGEKVVLRLLDKSRPLYSLTQLGMPEEMVERYDQLLRAPYGMVICAGPTGSGKTTTLYGSLAEINSPERNVMTIEDPVEYRIPTVNQIQINEAAGITFADGLRSILRQDPDVILVGEIRDVETARIAVQSALTGHFVLSSLHAIDAPAALYRLLDMGIEGFLVASSVTAVISQRLVRRTCHHCWAPYHPAPQELALLEAIGGWPPSGGFLRGIGCNFCARTGFLDRIGVYEMMPVTEGIRELVLAHAPLEDIRRVARREGMRTLQQEAARLVGDNVTTLAEVLRSIYVVGG